MLCLAAIQLAATTYVVRELAKRLAQTEGKSTLTKKSVSGCKNSHLFLAISQ